MSNVQGGEAGGLAARVTGQPSEGHPLPSVHLHHPRLQVQYSTVQYSTVQYSTSSPFLQAPAPGHAAEAVPRRAAALPPVTLALRGVPPTLSGKQEIRLCLGPLHRQRG